jgi:hypothetical protein
LLDPTHRCATDQGITLRLLNPEELQWTTIKSPDGSLHLPQYQLAIEQDK